MPRYSYKATNKEGEVLKGKVDAQTETIATELLEDRGLNVMSLELLKGGLLNMEISFARVSPKDLVIFSRQLSVLITADVPVVESLNSVVRQTENNKLAAIVAEVAENVEGGTKLSNALEKHPKTFDEFFVNIIRSGENSGRLDEVLNYLADQTEKDYELNSKIKGAMLYPAFILSAIFILGIIMMVFVVPQLTQMLTQTGAELPFSTRVLIGTSEFMQSFWWAVVGGVIGLGFLFRYILKTPAGRRQFDEIKLKMPVFGKLLQYIYIVRFSRSLKTLLDGGVPFVESLEIASRVVGNEVYKEMILETKREVENGNSVAVVFSQSKKMPKMVPQMLATGEQTGQMANVLTNLSNFYAREVTNIVDNLMTLLEPAIMVLLGLAVGVMVSAIVLPMYELSSNL